MEKFIKDLARQRRNHKMRIRKKRSKDIVFTNDITENKSINKHSITPKLCSCIMCGNPRNHCGNSKISRTIQEQRLLQKDKY